MRDYLTKVDHAHALNGATIPITARGMPAANSQASLCPRATNPRFATAKTWSSEFSRQLADRERSAELAAIKPQRYSKLWNPCIPTLARVTQEISALSIRSLAWMTALPSSPEQKSFRRRIGKSALRGKTRTHHPAVPRVNSKS